MQTAPTGLLIGLFGDEENQSRELEWTIKNVSSEEQRIQDAIQKTSELRFLLGEVESKLVMFRKEKEKLED